MKTTIRDGKTYAKLKDLHLWEKNPREASKENLSKLKELIQKLGVFKPLLVTPEGEIIGGNQRYKCYKELKMDEIWINIVDPKNDAEKLEYALSDNQSAGRYIEDQLQQLVLEAKDVDLALFELDLGPLTSLSDFMGVDLSKPEAAEDEFDADAAAEAIKKPNTKLGDLYLIDKKHRLLCGDSTDKKSIDRLLDGNKPILMVTDPPYGVNYDPMWRNEYDGNLGTRATGKVNNDDRASWHEAYSLFPGDVCYIWHGGLHSKIVLEDIDKIGFLLINQIIWVKQHFVFGRGDYHWQHEPCWYAHRKGKPHNYQGDRKQTTTWEISNNSAFSQEKEERTGHSTQKPLECMARPIKNNTTKGESVYDPFLGSGTTLIAAEQLGRICFGAEIDPVYCDVILERYKKLKPNTKIEKIK